MDLEHPGQLILGPFHGKVACQTIKIGKGVCGTVAQEGRARLLEDVETFPDHIACDGEDKSEIVAPIKVADKASLVLFPGRKFSRSCGLAFETHKQMIAGMPCEESDSLIPVRVKNDQQLYLLSIYRGQKLVQHKDIATLPP